MRSIVAFMYVNARELNSKSGATKALEYQYHPGIDNHNTKKILISVEIIGKLITSTVKEGPDDINEKNLNFERKEEGNEISATCRGGTIGHVYLPTNCRT